MDAGSNLLALLSVSSGDWAYQIRFLSGQQYGGSEHGEEENG